MSGPAENYDASRYERPSVTADVVVFTILDGELKILLVKRKNWPYQEMWAIPGGFVDKDERLEEVGGWGSHLMVKEGAFGAERAVVGEPTGLRLLSGHRGRIILKTRI